MIWTDCSFLKATEPVSVGANMAKNEAKTQETLDLFESYKLEEIKAERQLFSSSQSSLSSS